MVKLCMTSRIVQAIQEAKEIAESELSELQLSSEPSLSDPVVGNPISHSQLIGLSKLLRKHASKLKAHSDSLSENDSPLPYSLDNLLKGCTFYVPPPPPKKEPTPEYKALMARLRAEAEAREYNAMLNPASHPSTSTLSPLAYQHPLTSDFDPDDVSYEDVHRQIVLIINVLVSIIACSVFIWVAARHWSAPKRLGLSMGGSLAVAVAEVVVYSGYVRRVKEAKTKERKKPEVKKVMESWVIEGKGAGYKEEKLVGNGKTTGKESLDDGVRFRKGKHR